MLTTGRRCFFYAFFRSFLVHLLLLAALTRPPMKGYLVARGERERAGRPCGSCQKAAPPVCRKLPATADESGGGAAEERGERVSAVFFLVPG